jgi:excinuclease ABC subunit C
VTDAPPPADPFRPRPPDALRTDVRAAAENRPGVYRMIGPGDEVLYVGKSIRVRSRLLSYFRASRPSRAAELVAHTHRIAWEYASSEFAALLLELRAIRAWRPPFNMQHKRDRIHCFVKLTREEAPRLGVVFEVGDDGARYFGPFRGPRRVRGVVREVADLLELRDCGAGMPMRFADQLDLFPVDSAPGCLRADLGRCLGPCAGRVTRADYRARAALATRFFEGRAEAPLALLRRRMETAAGRLQFEYAASLRDRASRLEAARDELVALRGAVEALSFVYEVPGWQGDDRVYVIRRGTVRAEWPAPRTDAERRRLDARARDLLTRPERGAGVAAAQAYEILLLARWFRLRPAELERVRDVLPGATREGLRVLQAVI